MKTLKFTTLISLLLVFSIGYSQKFDVDKSMRRDCEKYAKKEYKRLTKQGYVSPPGKDLKKALSETCISEYAKDKFDNFIYVIGDGQETDSKIQRARKASSRAASAIIADNISISLKDEIKANTEKASLSDVEFEALTRYNESLETIIVESVEKTNPVIDIQKKNDDGTVSVWVRKRYKWSEGKKIALSSLMETLGNNDDAKKKAKTLLGF